MTDIGRIKAIFRYPVKSMAGEQLKSVYVGAHGLRGDRKLAFFLLRNSDEWRRLKAHQFPQLVRYTPVSGEAAGPYDLPTHARTPDGEELRLQGQLLRRKVSALFGSELQIMRVSRGSIDGANISLISRSTIRLFEQEIGVSLDVRRFRPNLLIETARGVAFEEDGWPGKTIGFTGGPDRPAIRITMRNRRCRIINIDPETGAEDARILAAVTRVNNNYTGVYAEVLKTGTISVGDTLSLREA